MCQRQPERGVTHHMNTRQAIDLDCSPAGLTRAADLLRQGRLVAFPTETVYGLGADARNGRAVAAVYEAKGRPSFNPLIVHVADKQAAQAYVRWSETAEKLATHFWPGPLSMVLPLKEGHGLASLVTAGLPSVALRVPAQGSARRLLEQFGGPVAAPSANPSGRISPTQASHVRAGLGDKIAAIVDDGPCEVGLESTIIGLTPHPVLLRAGGLPLEDIQAVLRHPIDATSPGTITSPGQMTSHYAPRAHMRLNAAYPKDGEVFLGFGASDGSLNLSPSGDLTEAAANLFDMLHQLDAVRLPIAVAPVPHTGLGVAINDRLQRAAAPRDKVD